MQNVLNASRDSMQYIEAPYCVACGIGTVSIVEKHRKDMWDFDEIFTAYPEPTYIQGYWCDDCSGYLEDRDYDYWFYLPSFDATLRVYSIFEI